MVKDSTPNAMKRPKLRQAVILFTIAVSLFYLNYRIFFTLNLTSTFAIFLSCSLILAETFGIISVCLFSLQIWNPKEPPQKPVLPGRTVDVFVPTYNEDPMILRATLEACMRLDYPGRRVYLCDDGGTVQRLSDPERGHVARKRADELKEICAELGVTYITREKNEHAKAGNLNHAFTQTDGEFIIIFDADHVPEPYFISRLIGYFADEKLGYIQTPHAFYNFSSFQSRLDHKNRKYWEEGALFYNVIQPGRNQWNCPIFAGSAAMFRRTALEEVGYIALETITEDMHTGMRMNAKGWNSLGISERMVAGQAAPDITTFHTQRLRWGEGNLSIMAYDNPLFMKGLTFAQRLCYLGSMIHWAGGFFKLIIYLTPILMMITGISPVYEFTYTLLVITFFYMMVSLYGVKYASNGYGSIIYGELFSMVNFWTQIRGLFRAIFWRKFQQFVVTSKRGRQSTSIWPYIRPQVYLFIASFLALLWGWSRVFYGISDDYFKPIIPSLWIVFHMVLMVMAIYRSLTPEDGRYSFRHAVNLYVEYEKSDGRVGQGVTIDLNELGAGIVAFKKLEKDEVVKIRIVGAGEVIETRGKVMWARSAVHGEVPGVNHPVTAYRVGLKFEPLPAKVFDAINRITLQYAVPRLYQEYEQGNKLGFLGRLWGRITGQIETSLQGYRLPLNIATSDGTEINAVTEKLLPYGTKTLTRQPLTVGEDVELRMMSPVGEVEGHGTIRNVTPRAIGATNYYEVDIDFHQLHGNSPNTVQELVSTNSAKVMDEALRPEPKPLQVPVKKPISYGTIAATALLGIQLIAFPIVYSNDLFLNQLARSEEPISSEELARFNKIYEQTLAQSYPTTDRLVLLMSCLPKVNALDKQDTLVFELSGRDRYNLDLQRARVHILAKRQDYAAAEAEYRRLKAIEESGRLTESERRDLLLAGARTAANAENTPVAIERFREFIQQYPDDMAARNEFAGLMIETGKANEVPDLFKGVTPDYDSRVMLMSAYAIMQDFDKAEEQGRAIRELRPNDPRALEVIADIMNLRQNTIQARELYERLARQAGADPSVRVKLGQVYLLYNDFPKALEQFQLAIDSGVRTDDAFRGFTDAAAGAPLSTLTNENERTINSIYQRVENQRVIDPTFLTRLAWTLERLKDYPRSTILLERARALRPNDPDIDKQFFGLLVAQGEIQKALTMMAKDASDPEIRRLLINAYLKEDDFAKAEKEARALVRDFPDDMKAVRTLADILSWEKKYAESLEWFEMLAKRQPSDSDVPQRIAEVTLWSGENEQALEKYENLLTKWRNPSEPGEEPFSRARLWPGYVDAASGVDQLTSEQLKLAARIAQQPSILEGKNVTMMARLGWILTRGKLPGVAEPLLNRVMEMLPDDVATRRELAGVMAAADRPEDALAIYDGIPERNAEDHERLATIYAKLEDWPKAKQEAQTLVKLRPADPKSERLLADVLSWAGEYNESLKLFDKLAKLEPDNLDIKARIAEVTQWSGDNSKALKLFASLLEKNPDQPNLLNGFVDAASSAEELTDSEKNVVVKIIKETNFRPDDAARLGRLAWVCHQAGLEEESLKAAQRAVALNPSDPEVRKQLGGTLAALGKFEMSLQLFAGVALGMQERLELANLYAATKNYDAAEKLLREFLDDNPGNLRAERQLADVLSFEGKYAESIKLFEELLKKAPNDRELPIRIAEVRLWSGDAADALPTFTQALKDNIDQPQLWGSFVDAAANVPTLSSDQSRIAVRIFERVDLESWTNPGRVARLGLLLHKIGRDTDSRQLVDKALALPIQDPAERRELAGVLGSIGDAEQAIELFKNQVPSVEDKETLAGLYVVLKDWPKAELLTREVLEEKPDDPAIERKLADVLSWKGDFANSLMIYEKLEKEERADDKLPLRIGEVLLEAGKVDTALKRFAEILKKQPELVEAQQGFVNAAAQTENLPQDMIKLAKSLATDPATRKGLDVTFLTRLSWILIREGDPSLVAPLLDRAIILDPQDIQVRRELAGVLAAAGRSQQALSMFGGVPATADDHFQLANIYASMRNFTAAINECKAFLEREPKSFKGERLLADLLSWNGEFDEAIVLFDKLAAKHPDDKSIPVRTAETMLWSGRASEALEEFEKLAAANPSNQMAVAGLIDAAFEVDVLSEDRLKLLELIGEKLMENPNTSPLLLGRLAFIYRRSGELNLSDEFFAAADERIRIDDSQSRRLLGGIMEIAGLDEDASRLWNGLPFVPRDEVALARLYLSVKDFPAALNVARELAKRDPNSRVAQRLLADTLTWNRDYSQAIGIYRKLQRGAPNDTELIDQLGQALALSDETGQALRLYAEAIQKHGPTGRLIRGFVNVASKLNNLPADDIELAKELVDDTPLTTQIPDPAYQARLGRVLQLAGRDTQASLAFDRAMSSAPKSPEARREIATALAAGGLIDQALSLFPAGQMDPQDFLQLTYLNTSQRDFAAAEKSARAFLQQFPDDPRAARLEADVLSWSGQYKQALEAFAELQKKFPNDSEIPIRIAETKLWSGDARGALADFARILQKNLDQPKAWPGFASAVADVPALNPAETLLAARVAQQFDTSAATNPGELARLARMLIKIGRTREANEALDRAMSFPVMSPADRREVAGSLAAAGRAAEGLKLFEGLTPNPDDRRVRAALLAAEQKFAEAERELRILLSANPDDEELNQKMAEVLTGKGDYLAALAIFDRLLESRPDDPGLLLEYSRSLLAAGQAEKATAAAAQVLSQSFDRVEARREFINAAALSRSMTAGENRLATRLANDPATMSSNNPTYLSRLAWILIRESIAGPVKQILDRAVALSPTDRDSRRELAGVLASAGRGREALQLFGTEAETTDDHYELANIYASLKEFEPAINEAKLYLKDHPNSYKARRLYADLLSWNRDFDEALVEFDRLQKDFPNEKSIPVRIAETTLWDYRPQEALDLFTRILASNPDQTEALIGFVHAAFESERIPPESLAIAREILAILTKAEQTFLPEAAFAGSTVTSLNLLNQVQPRLIARLGYVFHRAGNKIAADQLLNLAAAACFPEDRRNRRIVGTILDAVGKNDDAKTLLQGLPFNSQDLYEVARLYVEMKKFQDAIILCREIIAPGRDPNNRAAERLLGDALAWNKEYEAAMAVYRNLLRATPDDPDLPTQIAETYILMGEPEQALRIYQTELAANWGKPKLIRGLMRAAVAAGKLNSEQSALVARAYKQLPITSEIRDPLYQAMLGRALQLAGLQDDANVVFDRINFDTRMETDSKRLLAATLAESGRMSEALQMFEGVEVDPEDYLQLAYLNTAQKNFKQAEEAARAYLKDYPEDPKAERLLADVLSWEGKYTEALAEFEKLQEKYPNDKEIPIRIAETTLWSGDNQKALDKFTAILQSNLNQPQAWSPFISAASAVPELTRPQLALAGQVIDRMDPSRMSEPASLARMAQVVQKLGRDTEANALLDRAMKLPLDTPDARRELAGALAAAGRAEAGLALFTDVVNLTDADRVVIASLYAADKNWEAAERAVRNLLADKPNDFALTLQLAEILAGKGEYEAAIRIFDRLRKQRPDDISLAIRTANAAQAAGNPSFAAKMFAEILDKQFDLIVARQGFVNAAAAVKALTPDELKTALRISEDPLTLSSEDPVYLSRLAWTLIRERQVERADLLLNRAVFLAPSGTEARRELAGVLAAANRAEDALKLFGGKPETPEDHFRLAGIYAALKDFPKAIEECKAYIQAKPDDYEGERLLADLYSWGGFHDLAITLFEKLAKREPDDQTIPFRIAETLLWSGRAEDALDRFMALISDKPLDDPANAELVEQFIAAAFEVETLPEKAIALAQKLRQPISTAGRDPYLVAQLGYVLAKAGQTEPGTQLLNRAIDLAPNNDLASRHQVAAVLNLMGRKTDAETLLEGAPFSVPALLREAEVYQSAKDFAAAVAIYREVLKSEPEDLKVERRLADALSWNKEYDESLTLLRQLQRLLPNDGELPIRIAEVTLWSGDVEAAADAFQLLLLESPTDTRLINGYAQAVSELPRLSLARKDFVSQLYNDVRGTVNSWPQLLQARVGLLMERADKPVDATRLFNMASNPPPLTHRGKWEIAEIISAAGRFDEALRLVERLPRRTDDYLKLANLYSAKEDFVAAEKQVRDFLKLRPKDPNGQRQLADVLSWAGKYEASLQEFEKLAKEKPDDPEIPVRIAEVKLWSGNYAEAAEAFSAILAKRPNDLNAQSGFASALFGMTDPTPALIDQATTIARNMTPATAQQDPITAARYAAIMKRAGITPPERLAEKVGSITAKTPPEKRELASLLAVLGRVDEALEIYKTLAISQDDREALAGIFASTNDFEAAEKVAREAIAANPNDLAAEKLLADVFSWKKDYESAANEYRKLITKYPDNTELAIRLGQVLLWANKYQPAADTLQPLLAKKPTDIANLAIDYMAALANIENPKREQLNLAVRVAQTEAAEKSEDVNFLANTAWVLYRAGSVTESEKYLDRAMELKPTDPEVRKNLAGVLEVFGRTKDALAMFDGLTLTTGDRFRLAGLFATDKQYDKALSEVKMVLDSEPNNLDAIRLQADVLSWNGDYNQALREFQRLARLEPNDQSIPVRIAQVNLWAGNYDLAADEFRAVLQKDFNQPSLWPEFVDAVSSAKKPAQADAAILDRIFNQIVGKKFTAKELYPEAEEGTAIPIILYSRLAWAMFQFDDKDKARRLLDIAIERNPREPDVRREVAGVLASVGRFDEAILMYEAIPELELRDRLMVANLFVAKSRFQDAIPRLREMVRQNPEDNNLRLLFAEVLAWGGEYPESIRELERLQKLEPNNVAVLGKLATVLTWSKSPQRALPLFQKSLGNDINQPELWSPFLDAVASTATQDMDTRDLVRRVTERVVAAGLQDPTLFSSMAGALNRVGQRERALSILRTAVDNNPESRSIRSRYAETLSLVGRTREAEEQYEILLRQQRENNTRSGTTANPIGTNGNR